MLPCVYGYGCRACLTLQPLYDDTKEVKTYEQNISRLFFSERHD